MKIQVHPVSSHQLELRPAKSTRPWMDDSANKNPYRCLPLSMANSYGWEIISASEVIAEWNGGPNPADVRVTLINGSQPPSPHFGEGTLTWHSGYLFKTEYPYGIYVTGSPNHPTPNIMPMSGIVETYWLPFTFTINWRFTQPGIARIKQGDVVAQVFPVDMHMFDNMEAEIVSLSDNPELEEQYWQWNISRTQFLKQKNRPPEVWQRNYFQGKHPHTGEKEPTHRTKPNTPEFVDKTTTPYHTPERFAEVLGSSILTNKVEVL